ncbi:sigma-54-dependent transcriptional regulator [Vibrio salinus]|uniref:sigma-54-dependent transcriptional regulator n=1 Tax=Vibrio salinus TaxID=2899784 RepID=UPI001E2B94E8|nr:sigma-54 dependent transcriptional regulator [Vibrio salinus]MCE0492523.1 sigma-54 dependent transcriptional regulator [Vibrio salinus]
MTQFSEPPVQEKNYSIFSILIVDDEEGMQVFLKKAMTDYFHRVDSVGSIEEAEELRKQNHYDVFLLDINLPGRSGLEWKELFGTPSESDIIFMTGYATIDMTIEALKLGASDFVLKPFSFDHLLSSVTRCLDKRILIRHEQALSRDLSQLIDTNIVGTSEKTKQLKQVIQQFAPSRANIIIHGEAGAGKERAARRIHKLSGRSGPFVSVNCSTLSFVDIDRELFGSNAKDKEGLFTIANGGTLYFDEITDLNYEQQGLLLSVIQKRSIKPLGSSKEIPIDVRIITSTVKDILEYIDNGLFRGELYYKLAVLKIEMPTLRERRSDIKEIIIYFTKCICKDLALPLPQWLGEIHTDMYDYEWPGNTRELRNLVERCLLLNISPLQYWNRRLDSALGNTTKVTISVSNSGYIPSMNETSTVAGYPSDWSLKDIEKSHILKVVEHFDGNKSAAAKVLGVSRKTIERKYKEWEEESNYV